ncbi:MULTISPECIES: type II toxin-antitoxin system RelE/ParE family toxin [Bacillales]|uniref:ParE-like toxin of type II toxin-antitoxin system n=1 Tax=Parageobacillus thermantarcticus TaxID=186116 RepID=A0A1I0TZS0_9BACL|nr:type II toxin-antitoxin system RelE/ParE family toxin [Parageobacillus thermantarcticus]SFA57349.1 ParE-like toxin of type II toxin-antitoxin system [Parageobacillus thermantarcticus]
MTKNNRLQLLPKAEKAIKKMTKKDQALKQRFKNALREILSNPTEAGEAKTGDLAGIYGYDIYHQGINYEIAYFIDFDENGNLVVVVLAGTRENFYDELKRYMKTNNIKPTKQRS